MAKRTVENQYENVIDMKKVPILPLDNRWHQLFPDNSKPSRIKKLEKEVMDIVKRESSVSQEMKKLVGLKKKLMKEIVSNMEETDEENEKIRQKKLETSQKLILDINNKNTSLENEKYELPYRLFKANEELLLESIDICYENIQNNERQIAALTEWIERTRLELKKNVVIRQDKMESNDNVYSYMHDMLGPRFMEIFDNGHKYDPEKKKEE